MQNNHAIEIIVSLDKYETKFKLAIYLHTEWIQ